MRLQDILLDSDYALELFSQDSIKSLESRTIAKETKASALAYYTPCLIRNKEIKLTPEEIIRQLYLDKLINEYGYPKSRIQVEYAVHFGREVKRADIVVMDKLQITSAYIIVELKKPKLRDGKEQLKSYCNATGATMAVWSNGSQISYYHRKDPNYFQEIPNIPTNDKSLKDILQSNFTFADLIEKDKLKTQKKSLKKIIVDMEDEVLANAGVDVFEEVFKLIFIKLYDELEGARDKTRNLEFKNYGESDAELKEKIEKLFAKAKKTWEGVFSDDEKIRLSPSHLSVCIGSLEEVKLFNSNLEVIDDAFEYLVNKSAKGEKGQYFTPRYVIDMCVKMLNPKKEESMIDTASGSCGFPIHTCFYVWRNIYKQKGIEASHLFTAEKKIPECEDYVREKIFGVDFDEKSVRVSKMLNLIAGDGHTNVLYLNSIDYMQWEEWTKNEDWNDVYNEGFKRLKKLRASKNENRDFNFDILMVEHSLNNFCVPFPWNALILVLKIPVVLAQINRYSCSNSAVNFFGRNAPLFCCIVQKNLFVNIVCKESQILVILFLKLQNRNLCIVFKSLKKLLFHSFCHCFRKNLIKRIKVERNLRLNTVYYTHDLVHISIEVSKLLQKSPDLLAVCVKNMRPVLVNHYPVFIAIVVAVSCNMVFFVNHDNFFVQIFCNQVCNSSA